MGLFNVGFINARNFRFFWQIQNHLTGKFISFYDMICRYSLLLARGLYYVIIEGTPQWHAVHKGGIFLRTLRQTKNHIEELIDDRIVFKCDTLY